MTRLTKCSINVPGHILKTYSYTSGVHYETMRIYDPILCYIVKNISDEDLCALKLQGYILVQDVMKYNLAVLSQAYPDGDFT